MSSKPEQTELTGPLASAPHAVRDGSVAILGGVAAIAVLTGHRARPVEAVALAAAVAVGTWLAIIDFRLHRLPNRIVGPLAAATTVVIVAGGLAEGDLNRSGRALGLGLIVMLILLLGNLIGGLGMGDVKYGFPMAATVGWFGWDALSITIVVTTLSGAVVAGALLLAGHGLNRRLSYGPYMALGMAAALVAAAPW